MAQYADPTVVSITSNKTNPGSYLVLVAGILAAALAVVFFLQTWRVQAETKELEQAIVQDKAQLARLRPMADRLEDYNALVVNLNTLFEQQKLSGSLLGSIESRLYKRMQVTALQVNEIGTVDLTGVTPDYVEYAKVYSSLTNSAAQDTISTVRVISVAKNQSREGGGAGQVTFTFRLTLHPQILEDASSNSNL